MKSILGKVFIIIACSLPTIASADFVVSGWIPYWAKTAGVNDVIKNINHVDSISPFVFEIDPKTGDLVDRGGVKKDPWTDLLRDAKEGGKSVIPSILWTNKTQMETLLADSDFREKHIYQIEKQILKNKKIAGVDIDYEGKSAKTKDSFSQFLTELAPVVHKHNKQLVCTIESRTPVNDRYQTINPELLASIQYSNDFVVIGQVCDQVRIMTYDQGAIDVKLNAVKKGKNFYAPIADPAWVEKVIQLAIKDIPATKISLGLATYGYVYELTPEKSGGYSYKRLRAINYQQAQFEAGLYNTKPKRNSAGELSYTYTDVARPGKTILVWFSDAVAIEDKIKLAKKYSLGGVSVFKFDGDFDPEIWNVLKKY